MKAFPFVLTAVVVAGAASLFTRGQTSVLSKNPAKVAAKVGNGFSRASLHAGMGGTWSGASPMQISARGTIESDSHPAALSSAQMSQIVYGLIERSMDGNGRVDFERLEDELNSLELVPPGNE